MDNEKQIEKCLNCGAVMAEDRSCPFCGYPEKKTLEGGK